jgi:hypothetical protein
MRCGGDARKKKEGQQKKYAGVVACPPGPVDHIFVSPACVSSPTTLHTDGACVKESPVRRSRLCPPSMPDAPIPPTTDDHHACSGVLTEFVRCLRRSPCMQVCETACPHPRSLGNRSAMGSRAGIARLGVGAGDVEARCLPPSSLFLTTTSFSPINPPRSLIHRPRASRSPTAPAPPRSAPPCGPPCSTANARLWTPGPAFKATSSTGREGENRK